MAFPYLLPSPHGHSYYASAQLAAFAAYVALLLGQGYRRGYPARAWLPLVAAATLALVLGCQLVLLPPGQWLAWLGGEADAVQALAGGPRSVVGGALASFAVVLGLRRALGFRGWGVFDAFAGPLCWAMAVQSVGCVLAGCCWGEATAGPWGVAYGPGTPAYAAQLAQGLLGAGAAHTLPLVPTQLLQLLLCAGTGLLLHATRHRAAGWPGGSRYLLAMGLLCLGRFIIEGYRDPDGEPLLAGQLTLAGVSLAGLRWFMLLEALGQLGLWAWLVRRAGAAEVVPTPRPMAPALVGLGLLLATARLAPTMLSRPEIAVLQALLLLVLLAEGRTLLVTLGRGVPRLAGMPLAVLLGGTLLLATAQAPAPQQAIPTKTSVEISGGYLSNYHDANEIPSSSGGPSSINCGGNSRYLYGGSSRYLYTYQQVRAGGGEIAVTRQKSAATSATYGGGLWVGQQQVGQHFSFTNEPFIIQPDITETFTVADVHAYLEQSHYQGWTSYKFRLGLHGGNLGHYNYVNGTDPVNAAHVMPEVMLQFGNPRLLYVQGDAGYGAENALGAYTDRFALGSGLGRAAGSQVLAGYAASSHYPAPDMAFASAKLRLPARTGLSVEPYFATDFDRHNQFSVKLHFRPGGR